MKTRNKLILLLMLLIPINIFALSVGQTVDDYISNGHTNGQTSQVYTFKIDSTTKQALKDSSDNMTWEEWLKTYYGTTFNNEGYYVVTTNGGSVSTTQAFEVSYDLNGGTSVKPNNDFVYNNSSIVLPSIPTRTGYTFLGWNDGSNTYNSGSSYSVVGETKFVARWKANTYSIIFDANGGAGWDSNTSTQVNLTYDKEYALNENPFKRDGFGFKEWNTKADGSGASYSDKQTIKNLVSDNNGSIRLYAIWEAGEFVFEDQTLTVTYTKDGGSIFINAPSKGSGHYEYSGTSEISGLKIEQVTDSENGTNFGKIVYPSLDVNSNGYKISITVKDTSLIVSKTATASLVVSPYVITDDNSNVTMDTNYVYTGNVIKPSLSIKMNACSVGKTETLLKENTDYSITYDNSAETGNHRVAIEGKGNYTGQIIKEYNITKKPINSNDIQIEYNKDHNYTGKEITPDVKIIFNGKELVYGYDYDLVYLNNINVAKESDTNAPTITITGKGNYEGSIDKKFNINANSLEGLVNITNGYAIYNGNETNGGANVSVNIENKDSCKITYGDNDLYVLANML